LAMVRLHGSVLLGQKLRVTLADPPPADSASRKRQKHPIEGGPDEEDEGDQDTGSRDLDESTG
jgi:hypothetical protein